MNRNLSWADRILIVVLSTLALLLPLGRADAGVIETPDHDVIRNDLVYAEHTPTRRFPMRHYFETLDGAAYTYGTYGQCTRDDEVSDRICRHVFWYAP